MESSSDSFAWTSASSVVEESDNESSIENMKEKHNDSDFEKRYKKKLHKKLFMTEDDLKHELQNGDTVKPEPDFESPSPSSATPKKRKRKREHTLPPSSPETKHANDYLEARVKQERHTIHTYSSDEKPSKSKIKKDIVDPDYDNKDISQDSDYIKKKKKSKRKKDRQDESSDTIIEDKFSAEETVVETRFERTSSTCMDGDEDEATKERKIKKEKKKKSKRNSDSVHDSQNENSLIETTQEETYQDIELENNNEEILNNSAKSSITKKHQKSSKVSDRIQFEDGEDLITETENNINVQSSKLRRFFKANPHLHTLKCESSSDSFISEDDDIWLFHCPHEINVLSLKDSDLSLDNKCKIKVNSQTYVGHVENEINRAAFLTFENNLSVIKSLRLHGVVNFRKRIPKPHFSEDNTITNNQTNFIPLPDTKCRHPLFGPDYKKAMKIPSLIKTRLKNSVIEPSLVSEVPKEEKKKREKHKVADINGDVTDDMVDGGKIKGEDGRDEARAERKRKRQRSHGDSDQPIKKKSKRIKHKVESAETWDSEKAIEENLFNY